MRQISCAQLTLHFVDPRLMFYKQNDPTLDLIICFGWCYIPDALLIIYCMQSIVSLNPMFYVWMKYVHDLQLFAHDGVLENLTRTLK